MTAAPRRFTGQWRRSFGFAALLVVATACSSGGSETADPSIGEARSGGRATVFDTTANAFATAIPSLTTVERRAFSVGNSFFNDNWVTAPASTTGRDGLGPLFNAQSCSSCHLRDGHAARRRRTTMIPRAACCSASAFRVADRTTACSPSRPTATSSRTVRSWAFPPRAGCASRWKKSRASTPTAPATRSWRPRTRSST